MTLPLAALAVLSLAGGFIHVPQWLEPMFPLKEGGEDTILMAISVAVGLTGIGLAYVMYVLKPGMADGIARGFGGLYRLVYNKYFVDEIYDTAIVRPLVGGSRWVLWKGLDAGVIDGLVNLVGVEARTVGGILKLFQSGSIRSYAAWVVFGSIVLIVVMSITGGLSGGFIRMHR